MLLLREGFSWTPSLIILGFAAATAPLVLNVPEFGGCGAPTLAALLLSATVTAAVVIRLRDSSSISLLPAVLVPSWLTCDGTATTYIALLSAFAGCMLRSRSLAPSAFSGFAALGGALTGSSASSTVPVGIPFVFPNSEESVSAVLFVAGYSIGELALLRLGRRLAPSSVTAVARSNVGVNLLLLFPGSVIAQVHMQQGLLFSGPLLLVLVLALWLITLYAGASAARQGAVASEEQLQSVIAHVPEASLLGGRLPRQSAIRAPKYSVSMTPEGWPWTTGTLCPAPHSRECQPGSSASFVQKMGASAR